MLIIIFTLRIYIYFFELLFKYIILIYKKKKKKKNLSYNFLLANK